MTDTETGQSSAEEQAKKERIYSHRFNSGIRNYQKSIHR